MGGGGGNGGGKPPSGSSKGESLKKAEAAHAESGSKTESSGDTSTGCQPCHLKVTVHDQDGKPVLNATVEVKGATSNPAASYTKEGVYDCGEVTCEKYEITVSKDWHVEPGTRKDAPMKPVVLTSGSDETVSFTIHPVEIHMHLDADRDGKADPTRNGMDEWEWGKGKKGAIILCNNDDDHAGTKNGLSDHEDDKVNDHNDSDELAPLEFRRKGPKPPVTWKGKLEILEGNEDKVRIFEARAAGTTQLVGKDKAASKELTDLEFKKLECGMEAVQYADKDWTDGIVKLKFTLTDSKGKTKTETGRVRVAPWMMLHHGIAAEEVYVIQTADNATFRTELGAALPGGITLNESVTDSDRWAQDIMEIGYSSFPSEKKAAGAINAIARNYQGRTVADKVKGAYRDRDVGYQEPVTPLTGDNRPTANSFGNLEVTPPCKSKAGTEYPYGRIYFGPNGGGDTFSPDYAEFLRRQIVQKPFELDTSWLAVGHVDEIITFAPAKGGFKALVASPQEAYRILEDLLKAGNGDAKLLMGRRLRHRSATGPAVSPVPWQSFEISVSDILKDGFDGSGRTALRLIDTAKKLRDYNDEIQDKIDATIHDKFPKEIGFSVPRLAKDIREAGAKIQKLNQEAADAEAEAIQADNAVAKAEQAEKDAAKAKAEWEQAKKEELEAWDRWEASSTTEDETKWDAAFRVANEKEEAFKAAEEKRVEADEVKRAVEADPDLAKNKREEAARKRTLAGELAKKEVDAKKEDELADVIRVPVLFLPYGGTSKQAIAMTAGTVNMLVVNGTCVYPKPFGPVVGTDDMFQQALENKLKALGATPKPLDDWYTYHALAGEVHCGTNTRRSPPDWKWWEYEP